MVAEEDTILILIKIVVMVAWICINGNVTIIIVFLKDKDMEGVGMATLMIGIIIVIDHVLIHTTNMEAIQTNYYLKNFAVVRKRFLFLEEKEVAFSAIGSKKIVPKVEPVAK